MENLNSIVVANRASVKSLSLANLESKEMFASWKSSCESLRLAISAYAVADRSGKDNTEAEVSACFTAYRAVLKFFENKAESFKLKPEAQDIGALRDICGQYKKIKGSVSGKDFMPISSIAFRKALEDFIADRITSRTAKTAEEIEAEKTAKREARKAERKAKKDAENTANTAA